MDHMFSHFFEKVSQPANFGGQTREGRARFAQSSRKSGPGTRSRIAKTGVPRTPNPVLRPESQKVGFLPLARPLNFFSGRLSLGSWNAPEDPRFLADRRSCKNTKIREKKGVEKRDPGRDPVRTRVRSGRPKKVKKSIFSEHRKKWRRSGSTFSPPPCEKSVTV